jgi:hypothetical protein
MGFMLRPLGPGPRSVRSCRWKLAGDASRPADRLAAGLALGLVVEP